MIHFFVILIFACLYASTAYVLYKTDWSSIGFSDGILVGLVYFLAIPLVFVLAKGSLSDDGLSALGLPPYRPYVDLSTTLVIIFGWITVLLARLTTGWRKLSTPGFRPCDYKRQVFMILILYFAISAYSLRATGYGSQDMHWAEALGKQFSSSTSFIILKNFSGVYRAVIFGAVLVWVKRGNGSPTHALVIAAVVTVFDLATSFNRITIVFFVLFFVLLSGRRSLPIIALLTLVTPVASKMSLAWPMFRGLVFSSSGLNWENISRTWVVATDAVARLTGTLDAALNSVFEASNLLVLNFIVNNVGDRFPLLWGETFVLRPLTAFLPSSIWAGKPREFGTIIGDQVLGVAGLPLNSTLYGEVFGNFSFGFPA